MASSGIDAKTKRKLKHMPLLNGTKIPTQQVGLRLAPQKTHVQQNGHYTTPYSYMYITIQIQINKA